MIIERLESKEGLSYTEEEIADYILDHKDKVMYMTIQELAKETYSSNVTIIRLCRKLGCKGFKDFKIVLTKEIENKRSNTYIDVNKPFYLGENHYKIVEAIETLYKQTVNDCYQAINKDDLNKVAQMMLEAKRIYIYSIGDSSLRARSFINRLIKIGILCIDATRHREELPVSLNATSEDIAIFITYGARSTTYNSCAKVLKERNCPVIVISSDVKEVLTEISDVHIRFPKKEDEGDLIGSFYSQICFDFILNCLYSLMYASNYSKNHSHKQIVDLYVKNSK